MPSRMAQIVCHTLKGAIERLQHFGVNSIRFILFPGVSHPGLNL